MRFSSIYAVVITMVLVAGSALAQTAQPAAGDNAPAAQQAPAAANDAGVVDDSTPAAQPAAATAAPAANAPAAGQAPATADAAAPAAAPQATPPPPPAPAQRSAPAASNVGQVIDRLIQRERAEVTLMTKYHPMVETYIQMVHHDEETNYAPHKDMYFLGRLDLDDGYHERFFLDVEKTGFKSDVMSTFSPMQHVKHYFTRYWKIEFFPIGFASMIFPDAAGFDKNNYTFQFLRREFLGDVRCFVFHVVPKNRKDKGKFMGRIWVEDHDYNIVRFNGLYLHPGTQNRYFHFDSWRNNIQPGQWLPATVYSEESEAKAGVLNRRVRFKAQTRLWGYDLKHAGRQEEFSNIEIEDSSVKQDEEAGLDFSPVMSLRAWEREAEDNVLDRLEKAGLLAPAGDVDKILVNVVNNVEAGNDMDIEPEVRCRVLLTSPLETASIGHTIVISRGLLDVLPDEASLAMILTHELGHIARGEEIDTKYSFGDRMEFNDRFSYQRFPFARTQDKEEEADKKALELLKKSVYGDKLKTAGLFLKQLQARAVDIPELTKPHLGNGLVQGTNVVRMPELMNGAPELQPKKLDQLAALPLGGRVKVDAWDGKLRLMKSAAVRINSPFEKMPFEIAPAVQRLTRLNEGPLGAGTDTTAGK